MCGGEGFRVKAMRSLVFLSALLSVLLIAIPQQSRAQLLMPGAEEKKAEAVEIFQKMPKEWQDDILDETQKIESDCRQQKTYSEYHDCNCIADKFFVERVFKGPEDNADILLFQLDKDCINEEGIMARSVEKCLNIPYIAANDLKISLCSCYADQMAQQYKKYPNADYRHIGKLSSSALIHCRRLERTGQLPIIEELP